MSTTEDPSEKFMPPARAVSLPLETLRDRLTPWLRERFAAPDLRIVDIRSPGAAGVNNETLLLDVDSSVAELNGVDGLVVRLEAPTTLFPGFDIVSSYRCYEVLQDEPVAPTPRVYGLEQDETILGRRFYAMERIAGLIPADNPTYHQSGWVKGLPVAERTQCWDNAIRTMARLHRAPLEKFGFLRDMGVGTLQQQMAYWRRYYDENGVHDALLERTWDWLVANCPADAPEGFSWGDSRPPNMIFRGLECVGLLDWDMVSLVGPECDIAWWMLNDLSGSSKVGRLEGLPAARELVRIWEDESGRKVRNMEFWFMFNLYRLGSIMRRLKGFLASLGTPPEAIGDMDRVNTATSILTTRWGLGEGFGVGHWKDVAPAIDA